MTLIIEKLFYVSLKPCLTLRTLHLQSTKRRNAGNRSKKCLFVVLCPNKKRYAGTRKIFSGKTFHLLILEFNLQNEDKLFRSLKFFEESSFFPNFATRSKPV